MRKEIIEIRSERSAIDSQVALKVPYSHASYFQIKAIEESVEKADSKFKRLEDIRSLITDIEMLKSKSKPKKPPKKVRAS